MRALLLLLAALLAACPPSRDDDDAVNDDDAANDDDSAVADDDDSTDAPVPCVDDAFEENDTFETARLVSIGAYNNLSACPFDDDWYEIELPGFYRVTIQAVFAHAAGDIDLALRNESGEIIEFSNSATDNEQVGPLIITADQSLFLEVELLGFGGDPEGNTYGFAILTEPVPTD